MWCELERNKGTEWHIHQREQANTPLSNSINLERMWASFPLQSNELVQVWNASKSFKRKSPSSTWPTPSKCPKCSLVNHYCICLSPPDSTAIWLAYRCHCAKIQVDQPNIRVWIIWSERKLQIVRRSLFTKYPRYKLSHPMCFSFPTPSPSHPDARRQGDESIRWPIEPTGANRAFSWRGSWRILPGEDSLEDGYIASRVIWHKSRNLNHCHMCSLGLASTHYFFDHSLFFWSSFLIIRILYN